MRFPPSRIRHLPVVLALVFLLTTGTNTSSASRVPDWCKHLFGEEGADHFDKYQYQNMTKRPGGYWTRARVREALVILAKGNVPLYSTYLKDAKDPRGDRLLREHFQQQSLTLSRLAGAITHHYRNLSVAALEAGIMSQTFAYGMGRTVTDEEVVQIFGEILLHVGTVKSKDLLRDNVACVSTASERILGKPLNGPELWAWSRLHFRKISEPLLIANARMTTFSMERPRFARRNGRPSVSQSNVDSPREQAKVRPRVARGPQSVREYIEMSQMESVAVGVALFAHNFKLYTGGRKLNPDRDVEIMAISLRTIGKPTASRDIIHAAQLHYGNFDQYVEAVRAARANEARASTVKELTVDIDGKGRYQHVRGSRPGSPSEEVLNQDFWERADAALAKMAPSHASAARVLIQRITQESDVLPFEEAVQLLRSGPEHISEQDAQGLLMQLGDALQPAA